MLGCSLGTSGAGSLAQKERQQAGQCTAAVGPGRLCGATAWVGAGTLTRALGEAAAPRSRPAIKQAESIGQGVRLTMKYDGLTAKAAAVTCFQTLHLEVIILLDASYNL